MSATISSHCGVFVPCGCSNKSPQIGDRSPLRFWSHNSQTPSLRYSHTVLFLEVRGRIIASWPCLAPAGCWQFPAFFKISIFLSCALLPSPLGVILRNLRISLMGIIVTTLKAHLDYKGCSTHLKTLDDKAGTLASNEGSIYISQGFIYTWYLEGCFSAYYTHIVVR